MARNTNWKQTELRICRRLSKMFFGIETKKGQKASIYLPLVRANNSGAQPTDVFSGDVVPNGRWIGKGFLDYTGYTIVTEVKDPKEVSILRLLRGTHSEIFNWWNQAEEEAHVTGKNMVPLLIVNIRGAKDDYCFTDWEKISKFAPEINPAKRSLELYSNGEFLFSLFTLKEWEAANPEPPFIHLVRRLPE